VIFGWCFKQDQIISVMIYRLEKKKKGIEIKNLYFLTEIFLVALSFP
jgi:hypothetical protein